MQTNNAFGRQEASKRQKGERRRSKHRARTHTMSTGFDVGKSRVSEDALATFLASPISDDLTSVPGIGAKAVALLGKEVDGDSSVTTTFQLLGKYLSLKSKNVSQDAFQQSFWYYLQARGVDSFRSGIVHACSEKLSVMMPNLFDVAADAEGAAAGEVAAESAAT